FHPVSECSLPNLKPSNSIPPSSIPYLQIEPTTRCNFTCGFCAGRHLPQLDLDFDTFARLIDRLDDVRHVELQGEGEPLMHPRFFDMVRHLRNRFPAVKISLITNGSLFTAENIEQLLQCQVNSIMVSLESADAATFQQIRGGKLSRVERGIQHLLAQRKQRGLHQPTLGFAVTLLRETGADVSAIADLYVALGLDGGILLQPLQTMPAYSQFYDADMRANLLQAEDVVRINHIIAGDKTLKAQLRQFQQSPHFYSELYRSPEDAAPTCPWLERGLFISASGHAASCCFVKQAERDGFCKADAEMSTLLERRAALLQTLKAGQIPAQCNGCGLAKRMQNGSITSI
ncbi:MAG TPA: radical SAM protein, partial [Dongiaceae bacterium]|nr:radical SAM protein [Dongiaceae bacterium]